MNRAFIPVLLLLAACAPLQGEWEGEVRCDGEELEVFVQMEWNGRYYEGDGALNCAPYWGDDCVQEFLLDVRPEDGPFAGELDVDVDDCRAVTADGTVDLGCNSPEDVEWDGGDRIEGDWADCELRLDRR